ncbi:MAG: T9SS type A sorting domain-containing protein [Bacteroidales bacterium]|nr:T9SS type A sorting domain-containing protein [Bacteroidales bacterium]
MGYRYDSSGNRTQRTIVFSTTSASSASAPSSVTFADEVHPDTRTSSPGDFYDDYQHYEDVLGERKVVIYPNPTRGLIRIDFDGYAALDNARLLLYNIQGRLLYQEHRVGQSNTLDLSSYPSGMYILHLVEGSVRNQWKIIKE